MRGTINFCIPRFASAVQPNREKYVPLRVKTDCYGLSGPERVFVWDGRRNKHGKVNKFLDELSYAESRNRDGFRSFSALIGLAVGGFLATGGKGHEE